MKAAEAQRMTDIAVATLSHTRNTYRTLAASFAVADLDLNEGLHNVHQLVAAKESVTGWI